MAVWATAELHQWDSGYNIYHKPQCGLVASFIGQGVRLPGTVTTVLCIGAEAGITEGKLEMKARAVRGAKYLYTLALSSDQPLHCPVQSRHTISRT